MNKTAKTTVVDMSALKVAFEGVQPKPASIIGNMINLLSSEYSMMDEAIAHRAEAMRLEGFLGSLKADYSELAKKIAKSNADMFSIGKRIARAREEALKVVAGDAEYLREHPEMAGDCADLKKLEVFLKGKGLSAKWESTKATVIEQYIEDVIGDDLRVLAQIKTDAPKLLKDMEHLSHVIEQTQDTIAIENKLADDLVK